MNRISANIVKYSFNNIFENSKKITVIALLLSCFIHYSHAAKLTDFSSIIVAKPSRFAQLAAEELTRISGIEFSVSDEIPGNTSACIILEANDQLETDEYFIELKGKSALIRGKNAGLLYGTYAFLRRFGWKYYAPECEKAPEKEMNISNFQENRMPDMEFRSIDFNFGREMDHYCWKAPFVTIRLGFSPFKYFKEPGLASMVIAPQFEKNSRVDTWHTNSAFTPHDEKYIKANPELYAKDRKGNIKGFSELYGVTGMIHACGSNPQYRKIATEKVMYWLEHSPSALAVPVIQGDGHAWCECPECLALDAVPQPEGKMTAYMADRQLNLVNEIARKVAEKYPEKKVIFCVYSATTQPPQREIPEKNVVFLFCPYPPYALCFSHALDCPKNKEFLELMSSWQQKFPENTAWICSAYL